MTRYNPDQAYWRAQVRRRAVQAARRAEHKLAQLDLQQQIDEIDKKLAKLKQERAMYPALRAAAAQPSALDIMPAISLQGEN